MLPPSNRTKRSAIPSVPSPQRELRDLDVIHDLADAEKGSKFGR
jgi:hypothetical protein